MIVLQSTVSVREDTVRIVRIYSMRKSVEQIKKVVAGQEDLDLAHLTHTEKKSIKKRKGTKNTGAREEEVAVSVDLPLRTLENKNDDLNITKFPSSFHQVKVLKILQVMTAEVSDEIMRKSLKRTMKNKTPKKSHQGARVHSKIYELSFDC